MGDFIPGKPCEQCERFTTAADKRWWESLETEDLSTVVIAGTGASLAKLTDDQRAAIQQETVIGLNYLYMWKNSMGSVLTPDYMVINEEQVLLGEFGFPSVKEAQEQGVYPDATWIFTHTRLRRGSQLDHSWHRVHTSNTETMEKGWFTGERLLEDGTVQTAWRNHLARTPAGVVGAALQIASRMVAPGGDILLAGIDGGGPHVYDETEEDPATPHESIETRQGDTPPKKAAIPSMLKTAQEHLRWKDRSLFTITDSPRLELPVWPLWSA